MQSAIDEIVPSLSTFVKGTLVDFDNVEISNDENAVTIACYTNSAKTNGYYIMFTKTGKQLRLYSVADSTPTLLWTVIGS